MPSFEFEYRFHAAAQGTFASGILFEGPSGKLFRWVFDCGSHNSARGTKLLHRSIQQYRGSFPFQTLDLLCISHFDSDHVNGLGELIRGIRIGTLVLPYVSPAVRLVLGSRVSSPRSTRAPGSGDENLIDAIDGSGRPPEGPRDPPDQPQDPDEYFELLSDPVSFVLQRAASVGTIILVSGAEDEGRKFDGYGDDSPRGREEDGRSSRWTQRIEVPNSVPSGSMTSEGAGELAGFTGTQILAANSNCRVSVAPGAYGEWEFLFFHKGGHTAQSERLKQRVLAAVGIPDEPENKIDPEHFRAALTDPAKRKEISKIYQDELHQSGESINSASLCVYAGPLSELTLSGRTCVCLAGRSLFPHEPYFHPWIDLPEACHLHPGAPRGWRFLNSVSSILYTGDSDFKIDANVDELRNFLDRSSNRWDRVYLMQIPHHGSIENWAPGSPERFSCIDTVCCANNSSANTKHPAPAVINDLSNTQPVIVNKTEEVIWKGLVFWDRPYAKA